MARVRAPAALAERRKLGRGGEARASAAVLIIGAMMRLGAEIERAADQREIAERHAHQRRGAAVRTRRCRR